MAVYDYYCKECGIDYTVNRGINDPEVVPYCAEIDCGKKLMRRFSIGNPILKGEGFYSTDKKTKPKQK